MRPYFDYVLLAALAAFGIQLMLCGDVISAAIAAFVTGAFLSVVLCGVAILDTYRR